MASLLQFRLATLVLSTLGLGACAALDPQRVIWREARTAQPVVAMERATREAAYDFVRETIRHRYFDPRFNGIDWMQRSAAHRASILSAATDDEVWRALDRMAGELGDGHTRVESPAEAARRDRMQALGFGFTVRTSGAALVVERVVADSDAWWGGVRPGMRLLSIDNADAMAALERLRRDGRRSSTPQAAELVASRRLFEGVAGEVATLVLARGDGERLSLDLRRAHHAPAQRLVARTLPSGFGYLALSDFHDDQEAPLVQALLGLHETPGLIIDLRGNGGGAMRVVRALANELFAAPQRLAEVKTRSGQAISLAFGLIDLVEIDQRVAGRGPQAYAGPVVVLIDRASASAAELAAASLRAAGRARLVGETSCGCLLGFLGYEGVPGGGRLAYSEVGFRLPNDVRVEGVSVLPDHPLVLRYEDLLATRDRALETAEAVLRTLVARPTQ